MGSSFDVIEDHGVRYCEVREVSDHDSVNTSQKLKPQEIYFAFNYVFRSVNKDSPLRGKCRY